MFSSNKSKLPARTLNAKYLLLSIRNAFFQVGFLQHCLEQHRFLFQWCSAQRECILLQDRCSKQQYRSTTKEPQMYK